jgi:TPR repeat protein
MIKRVILGILALAYATLPATGADLGMGRAAFEAGDYEQARKLWESVAKSGDPAAQVALGMLYENGLGVSADYARAVEWYLLAADQGDARGQYELGMKYLTGKGVERDNAEALTWLSKAAEQGLPEAQYRLGLLLRRGVAQGGAQPEAAAGWLLKASKQGYGLAMVRLGNMYRDGVGVGADPIEAYVWYSLAEEHGTRAGRPLKRALESSFDESELSSARERIEQRRAEID